MVWQNIIIAVVSGSFALLGVLVAALLNRWQRREKYLGALFDKKIKVYTGIIARASSAFEELITDKNGEISTDNISKKADHLASFLTNNYFLISAGVRKLAGKFIIASKNPELGIDEMMGELVAIHQKLGELCRKELGLDTLEKDLKKL